MILKEKKLLEIDAGQQGIRLFARRGADGGLRPITVVVVVIPPEHVRIKSRPGGAFVRIIAARSKGVAGGADADQRLAGFEMGAHRIELFLRQRTSPRADQQQVGVAQGFDKPGETMFVPLVLLDDGDAQSSPFEISFRELRQGFPSLVFVLTDEEDDMRALVFSETKLRAAEERHAANGRAPIPLDVLDHEIVADAMRDVNFLKYYTMIYMN